MESKNVSYEDVVKSMDNPDVYLIEIREYSEIQETGLIPGSIHIPMAEVGNELTKLDSNEFESKYGRDIPKLDSQIIFTCRSGRRAQIVVNDLEKLGYTQCKYYGGSWLEWEKKNL